MQGITFKMWGYKRIINFKKISGNIPWLIVSGGDQFELREVFNKDLASFLTEEFLEVLKKIDIIKREIVMELLNFLH